MRSLRPRFPLLVVSLASVLLAIAPAGCGSSSGGDDDGAGPDGGSADRTVTWYQDIAPLAAAHCGSCHTDGGIGPFSMDDYESAKNYAGVMALKTASREMPPWNAGASDSCTPRFGWKDDPTLTDDEIAMFQTWADEGAPAGDPETAAPLPDPPPVNLGGVTNTVAPQVGYAPSGQDDKFICYELDPGITQDSWVTGLEVDPGELDVAHHAVVFAVPPEGQSDLDSKVGPDGYWDCFGGVTSPGTYLLGVWVPGSLPFEAPTGTGVVYTANTKIVLQMHYHPAGGDHGPDVTTIKLRATTQQPDHQLLFTFLGNVGNAPILQPDRDDRSSTPEFRIPANVADHTETMVFPINLPGVNQRFPIISAFPHMHYVGVKQEVTINRATPAPGEPSDECLMDVPRWNFDWQRSYLYDAPLDGLPTVGNGDTVTIKCTYDDTLENPFVGRGLAEQGLDQPVDVYLGETTLDEMCLEAFGIILN